MTVIRKKLNRIYITKEKLKRTRKNALRTGLKKLLMTIITNGSKNNLGDFNFMYLVEFYLIYNLKILNLFY